MAMSFAVPHGLTWAALGDLSGLINSIVGVDVLPRRIQKKLRSQATRSTFVLEQRIVNIAGSVVVMLDLRNMS
ncbi:hypothetical protein HPB52_024333 [Rhipicephalus sanguineus]|uniref:Uncharacterized protein n=1 Tax=Rhipicephalus sanguineus TaxID=34632 RepID=A0A9D4TCK4_RHISA|nr:hypothetical protein HPB52_024333 [Rhipicephalus sanguineus]